MIARGLDTQLDAADLAGGGGGVLGDEDDPAGPFEGRQAGPAELDQRVLVADRARTEQDKGHRLLQPVGVVGGHHDGLGHVVVRQQPSLHLGRGDPDAAGLEHVPGTPEAGVVPVRVHHVGVPGAQPLPLEHLPRGVVARPVPGRGRRAPDEQRPRDAGRDLKPVLAEHAQVVAWHRDPGRARLDLARPVGQEDVQHLGHADPVQDVDAEMRRPPLVQGGRESLAGRGGQPHPGEGVRGKTGTQHVGEEGRTGEEQRGGVFPGPFGHNLGTCRARLEHGGGPGRHREQQRVPQPVGEEGLGRGQAPVLRGDPQYLGAVGLAHHLHRAVPVHRALRCPGRPRGVQPESRRVGGRRVDLVRFPSSRVSHARAVGHHRHDLGHARETQRGGHHVPVRRAHRDDPGPGVGQDLGDAVGVQHGRDRHRYRADPHGRQVHDDELRRVRHDHDHPLLGLQAEAAQSAGGVRDAVGEFGVAEVAGHAGQREAVPVPRPDVPVQQVVAGVEHSGPGCHCGPPLRRGARSRSRTAGR